MRLTLLLLAPPLSASFLRVGPPPAPTRRLPRRPPGAPSSSCGSLAAEPATSTRGSPDPWEARGGRIAAEVNEVTTALSLVTGSLMQFSSTAEEIVGVCDELETLQPNQELWTSQGLQLRRQALEFKRYELLVKLLRKDYEAYVATASFLSPSRIPRRLLPNVQDIPYDKEREPSAVAGVDKNGVVLVADCELDTVEFKGSLLDKLLLSIFRKLVEKNTGGVKSDTPGLLGLLEQGRTFMLQPGQTAEAQHKMVRDTLGGLMTPVLPPFYRIFMAGIVPSLGTSADGKQIGPWFYAPWLTSFVTPTFFAFLVGPSYTNRRQDGAPGGLVVEKCQFLQESGCKGLCLHQCKLPAQEFFAQELGVPLTVIPNFETQECQWSFGQEPVEPADDPAFPKGCLTGCASREAVNGAYVDLCN
jgi:hypothetical protein